MRVSINGLKLQPGRSGSALIASRRARSEVDGNPVGTHHAGLTHTRTSLSASSRQVTVQVSRYQPRSLTRRSTTTASRPSSSDKRTSTCNTVRTNRNRHMHVHKGTHTHGRTRNPLKQARIDNPLFGQVSEQPLSIFSTHFCFKTKSHLQNAQRCVFSNIPNWPDQTQSAREWCCELYARAGVCVACASRISRVGYTASMSAESRICLISADGLIPRNRSRRLRLRAATVSIARLIHTICVTHCTPTQVTELLYRPGSGSHCRSTSC